MNNAKKDAKKGNERQVRFRDETSIIPRSEPAKMEDRREVGRREFVGERIGEKGKTEVMMPMSEAKKYLEMEAGRGRGAVRPNPAEMVNNREMSINPNKLYTEEREDREAGRGRGSRTEFEDIVRNIVRRAFEEGDDDWDDWEEPGGRSGVKGDEKGSDDICCVM
jgi:hypothetical protein